jgi:hypothetical protein
VDKVDIFANIGNYPVRLNRHHLAKQCTSLDTSVLALDLLNGHSGAFWNIKSLHRQMVM